MSKANKWFHGSGILFLAITSGYGQDPGHLKRLTTFAGPTSAPPSASEFVPQVFVTIDGIQPQVVWQNQTFRVKYTVSNFTAQPANGTIRGFFGGAEIFVGGAPKTTVPFLQMHLQPGETTQGELVASTAGTSGGVRLRVTYDDKVTCHEVPAPNGGSVAVCASQIHAEDAVEITVNTFVDILTSPDVPAPQSAAIGALCGGGTDTYPKSASVPNEWAQTPGGEDVPALGRVINRTDPGNDLVWDHPFGFDFWFNLAPDAPYLTLLNATTLATSTDCTPAGIEAGRGSGDICKAFDIERQHSRVPTGALHTEVEDRLLPKLYRPDVSDRVFMHGKRIVDCGHNDFSAEMHPPSLLAKAKVDALTGKVFSTLIAMPYRTRQMYDPGNNNWTTQAMQQIARAIFSLIGDRLEFYAQVQNPPFEQSITAQYRVAIPPVVGKTVAKLGFHFTVRPGVTVQVNQPTPLVADVKVVLDAATYVPAGAPTCTHENWSLEKIDGQAGSQLGTMRKLLNSLVPVAVGTGFIPPVGLQVSINRGLFINHCSPPDPSPDAPFSVMDNQVITNVNQSYPVYGWLSLQWDNDPMRLTVNRTGNGVVKGPGIDCGTSCSAVYPKWTKVSLLAQPNPGASFVGWGGSCAGTAGCVVTIDAEKTVTASFSQPVLQQHNLTVTLLEASNCTGIASARISSLPATLVCQMNRGTTATCTAAIPNGTKVTLTASALDTATDFLGFSGACGGKTCSVVMDANKTVTATFCGLIP